MVLNGLSIKTKTTFTTWTRKDTVMQFSIIVNIKLFEVFKTILNDKMVFFSAFFHFTLSVH